MKKKWSRFNYIVEHTEDRILIYNTYSLYYRWFDLDYYDEVISSIDQGVDITDEVLINEGYVVESTINELERLKADVREHSNNDYLYLVIYTTMACNYRCTYCFEGDRLCNEFLTIEKSDEIIDFAKRYCEQTGLQKIYIKWFGGEPLLNQKPIEYITNKLNELGYTVRARMFTNGRLLTKEVATTLKELRVDNVIIPLDGLAENYSKLKKCSEEDFYAVIHNVKDCEEIINIKININYTKSNMSDVLELKGLLRDKYQIKSEIDLGMVQCDLDQVSVDEYGNLGMDFYEHRFINRAKVGCEAQYKHHLVIGTNGDIYKCEHLTGIEKYKEGNIKDINILRLIGNEEWGSDKAIDDCKNCQLLPLCLGTCHTKKVILKHGCNVEYLKRQVYDTIHKRLDEA